ncbi:MAG: hypothetical protein ACJAYU_000099 [Bradymonadia bacterium]|jgi:hypothetical protein
MFYEVHFSSTDGSQRTLQVDAPHWMAALRAGIKKSGGNPKAKMEDFFVDLGQNEINVTDPKSRQTFRLREIDETNVRQSQVLQALTGSHQVIDVAAAAPQPPLKTKAKPKPKPKTGAKAKPKTGGSGRHHSIGFTDKATGAFRSIVSTEIQKPDVEEGLQGRVVADTVAPKAEPASNDSIISEVPDAKETPENQSISETALEDVFLEITSIFEPDFAMEDAIDFVIELAMKYVPSGSGGLMFAADTADSLYFAAARGAGKKKFLKGDFSIREGVPAAAVRDGIAIAVANPAKDGRHTDELADKGGFEVKSIAASPIQSGPRAFGALVLMNRKDRSFYSQYDANIVAYIGQQMGKFIQDQLDAAPLE